MSTSNLCQDSAHVVHIGTSFKENPLNIADIDRPLSDLTTQFLTGSIIDANYNDPVTAAVREYGEDTFYKSVADINTYFARTDLRALVTEADTPLLNQRVTSDYVFTPVEIATDNELLFVGKMLDIVPSLTTDRRSIQVDCYSKPAILYD